MVILFEAGGLSGIFASYLSCVIAVQDVGLVIAKLSLAGPFGKVAFISPEEIRVGRPGRE